MTVEVILAIGLCGGGLLLVFVLGFGVLATLSLAGKRQPEQPSFDQR